MTDLREIVETELESWHVPENKITIRDLLLRTALAVADRMCDPTEVGRQIGQLVAERDHARAEWDIMRIERDEAFDAANARAKQLTKYVAATEEQRHCHFEAMRKKQAEMDDLMQTIHDQAEIIQRLETRR